MAKTLVLIRHAHRDVQLHADNNGLSEKGHAQAKRLSQFYRARFDQTPTTLLSSPKRRCQETLQPIAKLLDQKIEIDERLDEEGAAPPRLDLRVESFIESWMSGRSGLTLVCSHGDWLPIAVYKLLRLDVQPRKASWIELEEQLGTCTLTWMLPTLKSLYD